MRAAAEPVPRRGNRLKTGEFRGPAGADRIWRLPARALLLLELSNTGHGQPTPELQQFMSPVTRGISYSESLLYSVHRLIDAAIICFSVGFALRYTQGAGLTDLLTIAAAAILIHHVVADLTGLYRSWRGSRLRGEIASVLVTWAYTVPVLLGVGLVTQYNGEFSYPTKLLWIFTTPAAMTVARIVMRKTQQRLRARGFNTRTYAV
jgi:hypothetical protein